MLSQTFLGELQSGGSRQQTSEGPHPGPSARECASQCGVPPLALREGSLLRLRLRSAGYRPSPSAREVCFASGFAVRGTAPRPPRGKFASPPASQCGVPPLALREGSLLRLRLRSAGYRPSPSGLG